MSPVEKQTICVIDDDVAILEVIQIVLEDEGFNVATDSGQSIDRVIQVNTPDLILLDIWMQGVDGRDVSRNLKENLAAGNRLPIVLMSAHSDIEKSLEYSKADSFLEKPFGMDELIAIINKHLA